MNNKVTRQVGKEKNILVIDLAEKMPRNSKYYYDFYHFDNDGAEKVAEIIYNNLISYLVEKYAEYLK